MKSKVWAKVLKASADPERVEHFLGLLQETPASPRLDAMPPEDVLPQNPFSASYAVITGTSFGNVTPCPGPHNLCDVSPGLVNAWIGTFDAHLLSSSPAIDAGDNAVCPAIDYGGTARPLDGNGDAIAICDIGAYEWWTPAAWVYLPMIVRSP